MKYHKAEYLNQCVKITQDRFRYGCDTRIFQFALTDWVPIRSADPMQGSESHSFPHLPEKRENNINITKKNRT